MKHLLIFFAGLLASIASLRGSELVNADGATHVALQAYDPVAFFADHKATKGTPAITGEHDGFTYFFASEEHKTEFLKDPEKYLPAYGGFCAYGVSKGKLVPVEIDTWEIVDGHLILQYSQSVREKFAEDKMGNLKKADASWKDLVARHHK